MAKQQKNLSPLELKHLLKYKDNQWCTLQELAVEMGHTTEELEVYISALGGLNVQEVPEPNELTPTQKRIRESFATRSGAVMMTGGASTMIEEDMGSSSFTNPMGVSKPQHKPKNESSIFRGNKPVNAKGNPYDERRN